MCKDSIGKLNELVTSIANKNIHNLALLHSDVITTGYHLSAVALETQGKTVSIPSKHGRHTRYTNSTVYAPRAAEVINKFKDETSQYKLQYDIMKYKYEALLSAFPDLTEYVDDHNSIMRLDELSNLEKSSKFHSLRNTIKSEQNKLSKIQNDIEKLIEEATIGQTTWLSKLIANYYSIADNSLIEEYKSKKHPIKAETAKDLHNIINGELKELRIKVKEQEFLLSFYQELHPEIEETTPVSLFDFEYDEPGENNITETQYYKLSKEEYQKLEPAEKNQRALDRYWQKRKDKWIIGRDYERYIGYKLEQKGYTVYYQGAKLKKEDLGIDLIAEKGKDILLIQCKYWRTSILIRENSINQLYGTGKKYEFDYISKYGQTFQTDLFGETNKANIKFVFITSTTLTETAKEFANVLGITVVDNLPLERYPIIKCNVASNGTKIYHLPFDQKYDDVQIKDAGEYFVLTITGGCSFA